MILLILPHQLFAKHPGLKLDPSRVVLLEDPLFFGDRRYPAKFHQQKVWLHRATMKRYESILLEQGFETNYVEYQRGRSVDKWLKSTQETKGKGQRICFVDPTDFMLEKRIRAAFSIPAIATISSG